MNHLNIKIFTDFDGTTTKADVGNLIFRTFAGDSILPIIKSWKNNEITSKQLLSDECNLVNLRDIKELYTLIDKQELDDYFLEFCKICDDNGIKLYILSDGMDVYIDRILNRYELNYIPFFSNKFSSSNSYDGKVIFKTDFPYTDSECEKCGNCKRNHLLYNSEDENLVIYIGDGYSDRCPIEYADIVFAKRELASYCNSRKIPFTEFSTFKDINEKLRLLLERKRVKKRRQAELKRKEIFMQG
jgi:2-hydroxy-3-keto-5-methylthiopentenyl-1-phosphate phosphatase